MAHFSRNVGIMPSARVSVIIPVFNEPSGLRRALTSIARQTVKPMEILVCDDGSTDLTTNAYLQSLGEHFRGIPLRVFRQRHAGPGAARNRCLAHARGDFVAFLDADDWWLPKKLARSLAVLKKRQATFVAHDFYLSTGPNHHRRWRSTVMSKKRDWLSGGHPRTRYFHRRFIGLSTALVKREALLAAGGFDADMRYGLDWDLWHAVLAANKGAKFVIFPDVLTVYNVKPSHKGLTRLRQMEALLPRWVQGVATAGRVPWQLLLARAWFSLTAETAAQMADQQRWPKLAQVVLRALPALGRLFWKSAFSSYTRPDFLVRILIDKKPEEPTKPKKRHGRTR